ncbi:MAG: hypothetical protein AB7K09_00575 [Planctomycetota bacterium]
MSRDGNVLGIPGTRRSRSLTVAARTCIALLLLATPAFAQDTTTPPLVTPDNSTTTDTGVKLTPFGKIRLDVAGDVRKMRHEDGVDLVARRFMGDDPEFWLSGNRTTLGLALEAPWMLHYGVAAVVSFDFAAISDDGGVPEAFEPRLRLQRAELILPVTCCFRIDAGYGRDVVAPLRPDVIDPWQAFGSGDIGWERARLAFRVGRDARQSVGRGVTLPGVIGKTSNDFFDVFGFSFAVADPRASALVSRNADGTNGDDGRDNGTPALHGRISFSAPADPTAPLAQSLTVGLSTAIAWQKIVGVSETRIWPAWVIALDFTLPLVAGLILQGEMWFGSNTDFVGGGMTLSGIDADTLLPVDSHGGWIQLAWRARGEWLQLAVTFGLDDPSQIDLYKGQGAGQDGGPDRVQFLGGSVWWIIVPNLVLAVDVTWWKAEFFNELRNESVRAMLSLQLDF